MGQVDTLLKVDELTSVTGEGASINHVDSKGGRGVHEKTMSVHKGGGGGVRGWSTWTIILTYYST